MWSRIEAVRTRYARPPIDQRRPIEPRSTSARTTPTDGTVGMSRSRMTRCFAPDSSRSTTRSTALTHAERSAGCKGFPAVRAKVIGRQHVPRPTDGTMGGDSGSSLPRRSWPRGLNWAALRFTPAFRRQLLRAVVVTIIFLAFLAGLAATFGIAILQYTLAGFVVSSIVIVAAIGLTLIYGIRGFANFAYGDLMTLGAYVALLVNLNGALSLVWGAIISFIVLAVAGILVEIVIFSHLEGRGPVPPIVASVGLGLIIQNGIRTVATTQQWIYPVPALQEIPIVAGVGNRAIQGVGEADDGLQLVAASPTPPPMKNHAHGRGATRPAHQNDKPAQAD